MVGKTGTNHLLFEVLDVVEGDGDVEDDVARHLGVGQRLAVVGGVDDAAARVHPLGRRLVRVVVLHFCRPPPTNPSSTSDKTASQTGGS